MRRGTIWNTIVCRYLLVGGRRLPAETIPISPIRLNGSWDEGFALDLHTLSSQRLKGRLSDSAHAFKSTRPPLSELLYRIRFAGEMQHAPVVAHTMCAFIKTLEWEIGLCLPMPTSKARVVQPIVRLARLTAFFCDFPIQQSALFRKGRSNRPLKEVEDLAERKNLLQGAFIAAASQIRDKNVLLIDDVKKK